MSIRTAQILDASFGVMLSIVSRLRGMYGPTQIATPTRGRKIAVATQRLSLVNLSRKPMMMGRRI
jgi:hypothetical protein